MALRLPAPTLAFEFLQQLFWPWGREIHSAPRRSCEHLPPTLAFLAPCCSSWYPRLSLGGAGTAKEAPHQAEGSPRKKETGQTAPLCSPPIHRSLIYCFSKLVLQPLCAEKRVHVAQEEAAAALPPWRVSSQCQFYSQPVALEELSRVTLGAATVGSTRTSPAGVSKRGSLSPSPPLSLF
ncbi:UNVERIFIED_CONTAM: hypothetical protein K2H54_029360 [Gekko kuhli]